MTPTRSTTTDTTADSSGSVSLLDRIAAGELRWNTTRTVLQSLALLPVLGLFWLLLGFSGLVVWGLVVLTWLVFPAVVPVAVGQLALVAGSDPEPPLLLAVEVNLFVLLVVDDIAPRWQLRDVALFAVLASVGGGSLLLLAPDTSLLILGIALLGGLIGASAFLSQLYSFPLSQSDPEQTHQ